MYKRACILFLYAEGPLHPGSDSGTGAIDLPVQRESGTGLPVFHGSGIKGALRDAAREQEGVNDRWRAIADAKDDMRAIRKDIEASESPDPQLRQRLKDLGDSVTADQKQAATLLESSGIQAVFGPETGAAEHGGAISVTEGRVLLFPVRSLRGTFAWVTSPLALGRLQRDLGDPAADWDIPTPEAEQALVPPGSDVRLESGELVLDEFTFTTREETKLAEIARWLSETALPADPSYAYWRHRLCRPPATDKTPGCQGSNLVVLTDDDFRDFCQFSTEIQSRNRIDPATKTVANTGLWTEEHLPAETLLYSKILAADSRKPGTGAQDAAEESPRTADQVIAFIDRQFDGRIVQMGGDASVGRGMLRLRMLKLSDGSPTTPEQEPAHGN